MEYIALEHPTSLKEHNWPEGMVPLVTVRVMCFNQVDFIKDCIEGVLMQETTFPVKLLIHDDASTDGTVEILKNYERNFPSIIQVYYQRQNSYSSNNKLEMRMPFFKMIKSTYTALCEGDDYWADSSKLQKQIDFMQKNPDCVMSYHDWVYLENGEIRSPKKNFPATLTRVQKNGVLPTQKFPKVLNGDTLIQFVLSQYGTINYVPNIKPAVKRKDSGGIWNSLSPCEQNLAKFNTNEIMINYFRGQYDISSLLSKRKFLFKKVREHCHESFFSFRKNSFFRKEILGRNLLVPYIKYVFSGGTKKILGK